MRTHCVLMAVLALVASFCLTDLAEALNRDGGWGRGVRRQNLTDQRQALRGQRLEALHAELGLTEGQQEQLGELRTQMRGQREALRADGERPSAEVIQQMRQQHQEQLASILTAAQLETLRERFRGRHRRGGRGLIKVLGLTEEQQVELRELREERREAVRTLGEIDREALGELRTRFRAQLEALLTPEQVEKLEALRERRMARRGAWGREEGIVEGGGETSAAKAAHMALRGNSPNPFNPETQIAFELAQAAKVRLTVFNALGQKVETLVDEYVGAGAHAVRWDAQRMPSGLYFYRLEAGGLSETRRMMLLK